MNLTRTLMLLAAMTALFMGAGWLIGGAGGAVIALLIAAGLNFYAFWGSDEAVLRRHGATRVTERDAPELVGMVRRLADAAGLPMPAVYVIEAEQPNAFATGRSPDNAAVAATTGLLRTLSTEELAGVMAHELAHVKNRDTLIMTVAATLGGAISFLGNMGMWAGMFGGDRDRGPFGMIGIIAAAILAPLAAMVIQMLISRTREYAADRMGGEICGNPLWLASALGRLAGGAQRHMMRSAENDPSSAHLFIVNPLSGKGMDSLFSTHPAMENRIAQLKAQAAAMGRTEASGGVVTPRAPRAAAPEGRAKAVAATHRSRIPSAGRRPRGGPRGPWGRT